MAVRAGRLRRTDRLLAAGFGAALALASAGAALAVVRAAASEHDERLRAAAVSEVDRIAATLERDLAELRSLASTSDGSADFRRAAQPVVDRLDELVVVARATARDGRLVIDTAVPNDVGAFTTGADLTSVAHDLDTAVAATFEEADGFVGAPFELGGRQVLAVAAPTYDTDARTEDARRASVTGIVVGAVDVDAVLGSGWPGGVQLTSPRDRVTGADVDGGIERSVAIAGRTWRVALAASPASPPASTWVLLGVGLLLSIAGAVLLGRSRRAHGQAEARAEDRARQLERIAETSARLQQSLDLAELLPAFAVALATDLQLDGVSISLFDDAGALVESFATGDRAPDPAPGDLDVEVVGSGVRAAAAGAAIELPLRRGWRSVGVLTVRPGRPLDRAEHTSLQALADLLAVAMSNAQLYEREQLTAARLRDLDALKNAFLGTVSHELRTSMTAIMGFGELLSDSWDELDDDRRREMAARIRRSAGSLRHLVDDLLDFARLEQERLRVQPRDVDLVGIVRQTVEGLAPLLGSHELDLQLPPSLHAWADPVAVERILANLLSNAAKYSPAGTTVTISVAPAKGVARLVVADEGPGIPPEERRRIFARFYRLSTPEAVRSRGAGIGLAILRDFADRSSAHVEVDDAPGGGARFTIDFPTDPIDVPLHDTLIAG